MINQKENNDLWLSAKICVLLNLFVSVYRSKREGFSIGVLIGLKNRSKDDEYKRSECHFRHMKWRGGLLMNFKVQA